MRSAVDRTPQSGSFIASAGHRRSLCPRARNMKLLTVQEVADTMKVSEKTVRRLIKRGDLAAYKLGDRGQLRVKERDLEQYVEAQRLEVEPAESNEEVTESGE